MACCDSSVDGEELDTGKGGFALRVKKKEERDEEYSPQIPRTGKPLSGSIQLQ